MFVTAIFKLFKVFSQPVTLHRPILETNPKSPLFSLNPKSLSLFISTLEQMAASNSSNTNSGDSCGIPDLDLCFCDKRGVESYCWFEENAGRKKVECPKRRKAVHTMANYNLISQRQALSNGCTQLKSTVHRVQDMKVQY